MKLSFKNQFYFLCLLFGVAFSCKEKDPNADCGCGGSDRMIVENVKGSYMGNKGFVLRLTFNDKPTEQFVYACAVSDTLKITTDTKNPDYIITGKIKKDCFYGPTLIAVPSVFEVTSIKRAL